MDNFVKEIQLIYDKLEDTISQKIFIDRLVYNLTGHLESLRNVIKTFPSGREFIERLNEAKEYVNSALEYTNTEPLLEDLIYSKF